MKIRAAGGGLNTAVERVGESAQHVKGLALGVVRKSRGDGGGRRRTGAVIAASTLGAMSSSLETIAEGARTSGFALRDRGRDAARALARGERRVRERGLLRAALGTALLVRRNVKRIAFASGALFALFAAKRKLRGDS